MLSGLTGRSVRRLSSAATPKLDVIYGPEHYALRDSLRRLIDTEINPHVDEWEEAGIFPAHSVFKTLGNAGFLGVTKPKEFGGLGLDYSYAVAVAEELGHIQCGGVPMAIGVQTDMATPALAKFGSDDVRERFLAPSIAGDFVACLGVSEASGGSDVASLKTVAKREGDEYVINGSKMWTTSGTQADWMCLLANTAGADEAGGVHRNKSMICVPMDLPGITVQPKFKKLGMRSSDTTQVFFEDVRVPTANLIGEEGKGFQYQMIQFQEERLFAAATVLLTLETCLQETVDYTMARKAFGAPLFARDSIQYRIAELDTELEALRSLLYRTTQMYVAGEEVTRMATMCKLKAGKVGRDVTDTCVQFWGGMGYMEETFVNRAYRDMRLISIGGGADEVMMSILAKIRAKTAGARK